MHNTEQPHPGEVRLHNAIRSGMLDMIIQDTTTDTETTPGWFLDALWQAPDGAGTLWAWYTWPEPRAGHDRRDWHWRTLHFPTSTRPPIPAHTLGRDVYFAVNPILPGKRTPGARSGEADVAAVNALYADFDNLLDVDAMFARCPLPPTAVICSGGGLHAYWILAQPLANLTAAKTLQKAWPVVVGADVNATGLHRPMRLPGTWNAKREPLRPVRWVEGNPRRTWYLSEVTDAADQVLRAWEAQQPSLEARERARAGAPVTAGALDGAERFATTQQQGNRNDALYWAARKWQAGGRTPGEIEDMARRVAAATGLSEREALATVRSAYRADRGGR